MAERQSRTQLREALTAWAKERSLDSVQKNIETVVVWVDLCAPPNTSAENLLLGSQELLVVFFSLDDYEGDDWQAYYDECVAILERRAEGPFSRPELNAYHDIIERIEARGLDTSIYRRGRTSLIEQYRWRNSMRGKARELDAEDYLERRRVTIYTRQWIDMWEVLEGCFLDPTTRQRHEVKDARREMVEWQLLQNDVVSVRRDMAIGEPNLVAILSRSDDDVTDDAIARVGAMRDQARADLDAALVALRQCAGDSPSLPRYCDILEQCLTGTIENYRQNLVRYDEDHSAPT